jgi:hypothetical protein
VKPTEDKMGKGKELTGEEDQSMLHAYLKRAYWNHQTLFQNLGWQKGEMEIYWKG